MYTTIRTAIKPLWAGLIPIEHKKTGQKFSFRLIVHLERKHLKLRKQQTEHRSSELTRGGIHCDIFCYKKGSSTIEIPAAVSIGQRQFTNTRGHSGMPANFKRRCVEQKD